MARFAWAHSSILSHLFILSFQKSAWQLKSPCLHTGFCKVYARGFCLARCNSLIISAVFPILARVVVSVTTCCVPLPGRRNHWDQRNYSSLMQELSGLPYRSVEGMRDSRAALPLRTLRSMVDDFKKKKTSFLEFPAELPSNCRTRWRIPYLLQLLLATQPQSGVLMNSYLPGTSWVLYAWCTSWALYVSMAFWFHEPLSSLHEWIFQFRGNKYTISLFRQAQERLSLFPFIFTCCKALQCWLITAQLCISLCSVGWPVGFRTLFYWIHCAWNHGTVASA